LLLFKVQPNSYESNRNTLYIEASGSETDMEAYQRYLKDKRKSRGY